MSKADLFATLQRAGLSRETRKAIAAELEATGATGANTVAVKQNTAAKTANKAVTASLSKTLAGLGAKILAHPFLAAVAAATLATIAIKKFTEAQEASKQKLEDLKESYNSLGSEVESLSSELETNGDRIKELQNLEAPTLADEDELRKLKEINAELELQLELKKADQADQQQKMAGEFVNAMQGETGGSHYVAFTSTIMTNAEAEQQAQRAILEAKRKIAEEGKQMDEDELARQKKIISENQEYLSSRLAIYEELADGIEYGVTPEADAFLDYVKDLRVDTLALSDSATSASTALKAIFADARYNTGVLQIKNLLADSGDDVDAFAASLKEAYDTAGKDSSLVQLIDRLQELGYFSWDNVDGLANTFRALAASASSAADAVGEVYDLASAIAALSDKYELLKKAQEEFSESGSLSIDTLNSIKEKFPALSDAIDEYLMGLKSTKELLNEMAVAYQTDENNYRKQLVAKAQASTEFFNQNSKDLKQQIDNLAEGYGVDLGNYQTVEKAKLEFSQQIIQKLAAAWGRYFGLTAKNIDSAALQMSSRLNSIAQQYGKNSAEYKNAYKEAQDLSNAAAAMRDFSSALDDVTVSKINFNPSTFYNKSSSGGSSKSSSSKTKSMEELYKELTDLQTNITRADDRLEKKAEDTTEEQIALWLKLRKAAVAELAKIKDHTSEAYRYVEDILKDANEHLDDLYDQQLDALDELVSKTKEMVKQEVEDQCDALEKQIDA